MTSKLKPVIRRVSGALLTFTVPGNPLPKQSYRAVRGGGYTDPKVKAWQDTVAGYALQAMLENGLSMFTGPVEVWLDFHRATWARVDIDNLQKCALDGLKGIVFADDSQVSCVWAVKSPASYNPRLEITVKEFVEVKS